jgi:hypothetical protein
MFKEFNMENRSGKERVEAGGGVEKRTLLEIREEI